MRVLTVNTGSSSVKLRLLDSEDQVERSADLVLGPAGIDPEQMLDEVLGWPVPEAVGHRIVHGGSRFTTPVRLDPLVRVALDDLTSLAPLHQPRSLETLDAISRLLPDVPAVLSFDTAFHATIPPSASTYAVPFEWRERYGIRRYGFHGLSHAYASRRAAELLGVPVAGLRIVTCHLGAGASLCAVKDGQSVDTTMGFTPLDGLVMATRSGSVDPGLVLWLEEREALTPREVADTLKHRSGLLGLAGSSDMRTVERAAAGGDARARLALDVYVHWLVGGIAAMVSATEGLDALVFTGGVGENAVTLRERAAQRLAYLGVDVGAAVNGQARQDADVSSPGSGVRTVVISAREDLELAAGARAALA